MVEEDDVEIESYDMSGLIRARSVRKMSETHEGVHDTDSCVLARYILALERRIEKLEGDSH